MRLIWVTWAQWRETRVKITYYVLRIVTWTLCVAKGRKKTTTLKFILKLKKKRFLLLAVFNQASVAWCKDFYRNLWFGCGQEPRVAAPPELHPSQLRLVFAFYSLLPSLPWAFVDPPPFCSCVQQSDVMLKKKCCCKVKTVLRFYFCLFVCFWSCSASVLATGLQPAFSEANLGFCGSSGQTGQTVSRPLFGSDATSSQPVATTEPPAELTQHRAHSVSAWREQAQGWFYVRLLQQRMLTKC